MYYFLFLKSCTRLSYLCGKFGKSFTKVVDFLRSSYANGITKISDLYDAATKFIMESWMGLLPFHDDDDYDVGFVGIVKRDAVTDRKSLNNEGMMI